MQRPRLKLLSAAIACAIGHRCFLSPFFWRALKVGMTRIALLSISILFLAITCLNAYRVQVKCQDTKCNLFTESTEEDVHDSQGNDSSWIEVPEFVTQADVINETMAPVVAEPAQQAPEATLTEETVATAEAAPPQAAPFAKVPRKPCVSTSTEAYCEAPCTDYEYGELPNLQMGRSLRKSSGIERLLARIDDSKDVIVKTPLSHRDEVYIKNDALQYKHLSGIPGIPDLIYAGPLPQKDASISVIIDKFDMTFLEYIEYWKSPRHPDDQRWPKFSELATVARELLTILKQVHQRGYRHRYITPESMMFKDGALYLTESSKVCPIGDDVCNLHGSLLFGAVDPWLGKEENVKDDLEMVTNLVVYSALESGMDTWDECFDRPFNITLDCLIEKKVEYWGKPTSCGVTGLDDVAMMIRSFDPDAGHFDYDAAIALLTDHSELRFPTQDQLDAEREAAKEGGQASSLSSLMQFSASHSMSSIAKSSAKSLPNSSSMGSFSNSLSASIVKSNLA